MWYNKGEQYAKLLYREGSDTLATEGRTLTTIRPKFDGILRRPKFDIRFLTEDSEFHIVHDTGISLTNRYMTESVVSISTSNAMDDDSSAFSFVLAGFMEWDKLVNSNDMIILKIRPSEIDPEDKKVNDVEEDVVMIGLVSEVRIEAEYSDDSRLYRITGQSFAKAFIQFELNTIRQLTYPTETGWLDSPSGGSSMMGDISGKTVAETVKVMYDRFIEYMDYDFKYITGSGGDTERKAHNTLLRTRIETNFSSWSKDEHLADASPFLNFEGSFNQMLNEVVTQPFCEMFFDVHSSEEGNEKAEFIVRRTPFDKDDWNKLERHWVYSKEVVSEDLAQSDLDAYAIFNVFPENNVLENTSGLVRPKYSPELVGKYGYKMLEVVHRFLSTVTYGTEETASTGTAPRMALMGSSWNNMYKTFMDRTSNNVTATARSIKDALGSEAPLSSIEFLINSYGGDVRDGGEVERIINEVLIGPIETTEATTEYDMSKNLIDQYSTRLYNWYAHNPNFYSGDIIVMGHPDFRLGNRLMYHDTETNVFMEFYIESVEHQFSYQEGYTTTLGVTRGLRVAHGRDDGGRFNPPTGPAQDFEGGYLGEMSISEMKEASQSMGAGTIDGTGVNTTSGIGWPATGTITSPYGYRVHPITGGRKMHNGLDIGKDGTKQASSMADGTVTTAIYGKGYGNYIMIDHGNLNGIGRVETLYAHLQTMYVSAGTKVRAGQNIGVIGTTGNSTGPHLHFEVMIDGKRTDPNTFLKKHAGPKPAP